MSMIARRPQVKVSVLASTGKKETEFQKRLTTKLVDKKGDKVLKDLRGERFNVPKLITTLEEGSEVDWWPWQEVGEEMVPLVWHRHPEGYWWLRLPGGGKVLWHRQLWMDKNGRRLVKGEEVHHFDHRGEFGGPDLLGNFPDHCGLHVHRRCRQGSSKWQGFLFKLLFREIVQRYTSSTAQGGGGSFKNRKPIGEAGCCESRMAERSH